MKENLQKISRKLIFGFIAGIFITGGVIGLVWRFIPPYDRTFELERDSNHPDGIDIILKLEQRNLLHEAAGINSADNDYLNLLLEEGIDYTQKQTINQSTIDYYKVSRAEHQGAALYLAYAWSINSLNLSYQEIKTFLMELNCELFLFMPLFSCTPRIDYLSLNRGWMLTQDQDPINISISSGWLIFQQLEHGKLDPPFPSLSGGGEVTRQISILDSNETLIWMASQNSFWMA